MRTALPILSLAAGCALPPTPLDSANPLDVLLAGSSTEASPNTPHESHIVTGHIQLSAWDDLDTPVRTYTIRGATVSCVDCLYAFEAHLVSDDRDLTGFLSVVAPEPLLGDSTRGLVYFDHRLIGDAHDSGRTTYFDNLSGDRDGWAYAYEGAFHH